MSSSVSIRSSWLGDGDDNDDGGDGDDIAPSNILENFNWKRDLDYCGDHSHPSKHDLRPKLLFSIFTQTSL